MNQNESVMCHIQGGLSDNLIGVEQNIHKCPALKKRERNKSVSQIKPAFCEGHVNKPLKPT